MANTLDRRAFGVNMMRLAAACALRSVGGARGMKLLSSASMLYTGCGEDGRPHLDVDPSTVALTSVHSPVVVIGTGYGGAVVAKRLSEKGVSVLMLEMGKLWNKPGKDGKVFCAATAPDGRAMWFQDKLVLGGLLPLDLDIPIQRDAGILDVVQSDNMNVYCGRGVGGGSLVNMAMLVTPPRDVLTSRFPGVDVDELLTKYYPRALSMLEANTIKKSFFDSTPWYQYSRVGYAASKAAGFDSEFLVSGYDYAYMEQEAAGAVPKSALAGEAGFGNNYGKQSVDKNYLADALATGNVTIESLHIVRDIRRDPNGTYVVSVNAIDEDGKLVARKEISCEHLFLCGGSMGTSQLLVRARETGTLENLNDKVGTAWGSNSDIFTMRANPLWVPTGDKVATVPSTGFRTKDQNGRNVFSMDIPYPVGLETFVSFNILMTESPETGTFAYDPVADKVNLQWGADQSQPAIDIARYVMDKVNLANLTTYKPEMFRGQDFLGDTTYHPVGGCPLGEATDDFGRVLGYENLYVADGSLIPGGGLVANPALTVAALTERNIERIIGEDFHL